MLRLMILALAGSFLCGCASAPTFPDGQAFGAVGPATPPTMTLFVDQKGTLYSNGWESAYPEVFATEALLMVVRDDADRAARLAIEQEDMRAELADFTAGARRVFVLIHGFNDPQPGSDASYAVIREAVAFEPGDAVIHFHWDGLTASQLSVGGIWFESAGNSQLAGIRALRSLLNDVRGKTVVLISHSRGASVILSALSNPAFGARREAEELADVDLTLYPPGLADNRNILHAIFLGPAIGCPDFWKPKAEWGAPKTSVLREFPDQLRSLQYTVNRDDWVLRKGFNSIYGLAGSFNATNFGWDAEIGGGLQRVYPRMQGYEISWRGYQAGVDHGFDKYARHPVLRTMLRNAGIAVTATEDTRPVRPIPDSPEPLPSSRRCQTQA